MVFTILCLLIIIGLTPIQPATVDNGHWLNDDFSPFWQTEEYSMEKFDNGPVYHVDFELLDACHLCLSEPDKVFLRYNNTINEGLADYVCERYKNVLSFAHGLTMVVNYVCRVEDCELEYLKFPYRMENIICAKEYYFPQYLRNAKRAMGPNFDLDGLFKILEEKERQWAALLAGETVAGSQCYCEDAPVEPSSTPLTTTPFPLKRKYRDPIIKFALS